MDPGNNSVILAILKCRKVYFIERLVPNFNLNGTNVLHCLKTFINAVKKKILLKLIECFDISGFFHQVTFAN